MEEKEQLPSSGSTLAYGVLSVSFSLLFIGVFFGIIALVVSHRGMILLKMDRDHYEGAEALRAGRTLAYIGIYICVLSWLTWIVLWNIDGR